MLKYIRYGIGAFAILVATATAPATAAGDLMMFRIGTGGVSGTYYPIGKLIAQAISSLPGSPACGTNESCGVPDLVAVAQISNGSVSNIKDIASGRLESGFAQADVAFWAFNGSGIFGGGKPISNLRAITSLYPESVHLVVRKGAGIRSIRDLRGKHVSLDEPGSGTLIDARLILNAYDLSETDIVPEYIKPNVAAEKIRSGALDAFFIVAGYPTASIASLTEDGIVKLLPIDGPETEALLRDNTFFGQGVIPTDAYKGIGRTPTVNIKAEWIVGANVDETLVYEITRTLWNQRSRKLLDRGHPRAKSILLDHALKGLSIPLHPGAARYYREIGLIK